MENLGLSFVIEFCYNNVNCIFLGVIILKKFIFGLLVFVSFTLTGCDTNTETPDDTKNPGDDTNEVVRFDIVLHVNGNVLNHTFKVDENSLVSEFDVYAVYDGHVFDGWYLDEGLTNPVDFDTVTNNLTLYAKWSVYDVSHLSDLHYFNYLKSSNPVVTITVKDVGVMTLELFPDVAQNTVDNFIKYIQNGDYSNSTFHRVIEDFMIQGGIVENTNCSIEGEFSKNDIKNSLSHRRGVISMARTTIMNSATSQFFIVHEDSIFLNGSYASFGGLTSGFDILDLIAEVDTSASDAPLTEIVIESITVDLNGYVPNSVVCAS